MLSDIQVFVRWKDQTIFAGENVDCTITFKHVASGDADTRSAQKHYRGGSRPINVIDNTTRYSPARSLNPFSLNNSGRRPVSAEQRSRNGAERGHRPSASLSTPHAPRHSFPPTGSASNGAPTPSGHRHKRSVSIISVEQPELTPDRPLFPSPFSPRFGKGHTRSASFQASTVRNDSFGNGTHSAPRSPLPRPRFSSADSSTLNLPLSRTESDTPGIPKRSPTTVPHRARRSPQKRGSPFPVDFKFPQAPPSINESDDTGPVVINSPRIDEEDTTSSQTSTPPVSNSTLKRLQGSSELLVPATKILSNSKIDGSTRSSGDFCSLSNNSTETLESDYVLSPMAQSRVLPRHRRHCSNLDSSSMNQSQHTQQLLMGYAQVSASFTIDGSLVNQGIFEEVKRNAVVGNQGRKDASSKSEKSRQSFWGNIGLPSIGDSITGLMSTGELNGLREMRGVSSSQSIPLLSTPQSLLFVDLRLGPDEERSFSFSFTLPKGLPASHKGKAIKFQYNLVIGTQRAANSKDVQRVNRINIPFRVLSGVDGQGGVLGHDLMRPYVLLRDEARVQKIETSPSIPSKEKSISAKQWTSAPQFLSYVDEILKQRSRRESLSSLASPTEHPSDRESHGPHTCKDAIDFAILRSTQSCASGQSTNRFEISRNGQRIAVVVLNRPAHRLGETIVATIDFSNAALPCYYLRGTLETYEKVNPTIALRSSTSITRATRKVHSTCFENTLFSTKVAFTPSIPVCATPTLITSGVSLEWQLRFEFVTCGLQYEEDASVSGARLFEMVEQDDRGTVFAALENILCQSFEVSIPLTVYGGTTQEPESEELQGYPI